MSSPLYFPFEKRSKNTDDHLTEWDLLSPLSPVSPVSKNGCADVVINDLYVENSHLRKALNQREQQQRMVEKRNYLLEQKISSLGKTMRPRPATSAPEPDRAPYGGAGDQRRPF